MSNQQKNQFQEYVNSKERATKSNAIEVPSISLPKGGGALKGIDEKFYYNKSYMTGRFNFTEICFSLMGYFLLSGFNKDSQNPNSKQ